MELKINQSCSNSLVAEVLVHNLQVQDYSACGVGFQAKFAQRAYDHVPVLQFGVGANEIVEPCSLGSPAGDAEGVVSTHEGATHNSIPSDGVPAVCVNHPNLYNQFGPTPYILADEVEIEGLLYWGAGCGSLDLKALKLRFPRDEFPILPVNELCLDIDGTSLNKHLSTPSEKFSADLILPTR